MLIFMKITLCLISLFFLLIGIVGIYKGGIYLDDGILGVIFFIGFAILSKKCFELN